MYKYPAITITILETPATMIIIILMIITLKVLQSHEPRDDHFECRQPKRYQIQT